MGATYVSVRCPWPTFANGRPARTEQDLAVLVERINDLPDNCEEFEEIAYRRTGDNLAGYGAHCLGEAAVYGTDEEQKCIAAGAAELRKELATAAQTAAELDFDLDFDGVRWWASTGGMSWGDSPSDDYDALELLAISGVCIKPLDAEEFTDVAAAAAAVAVLDDLAAVAARAVRSAGLNDTQAGALEEALEQARLDVFGAAKIIRTTMYSVTDQVAREYRGY